MSDDANFPKRSSAQRTGAIGIPIVTGLVENELKWHFRRNHQEADFGIDGYIDIVRDDEAVLGRSFAIQIKTGPSHVANESDQGFLLYGERKHLNYFLNSPIPVILVWVDDSLKKAWWVHVQPHAVRITKTGWSILVPKSNRFASESSKALLERAGPSVDYIPLLNQLNAIRNAACQSERVVFLITKSEVLAGDVSRLQDFFRMFEAAPDVLPAIRNKLALAVHGYNEDPREVFEIPEVRKWFAIAEPSVLGWSYFLDLNPRHSTLKVFLMCTCKVTVIGETQDRTQKLLQISKAERLAFIARHFNWLNQFTENTAFHCQ